MHSRRNFCVPQPSSSPHRARARRRSPLSAQQQKVIKVGTLKLIHGITPYFYEKFAPPGYKFEVDPVRKPDRRQERRHHRHRRLRHVRHRRRDARRRRGRAARHLRGAVQPRHGDRLGREVRHQDGQGPQRQESRDLAGLDAGSRDPRAAQSRRHDDQGHPADPPALLRHGARARARRRRRVRRRGAGPRHQPRERRRPDRRVSRTAPRSARSTWCGARSRTRSTRTRSS